MEENPTTKLQSGLRKILPDKRDYDFLPNFGATRFDTYELPKNFSVYDGRIIPHQMRQDDRFDPPIRPLPLGCTGETATFDAGIQDGKLYRPDFTYDNTDPKRSDQGRDMRTVLKHLIDTGLMDEKGVIGNKRVAYFNVYGSGKIDDFDAARIAIWINQDELRSVWVGSRWYWDDTNSNGIVKKATFKLSEGTLHAYLITGWRTIDREPYLEAIPWLGGGFGRGGICYISREIYNGLMTQPYTAAFTISKIKGGEPLLSLGMKAHFDHIVYALRNFIRDLFNV